MSFQIIHGDCLTEMAKLPPDSVDAIVTDPPYGLGFMGKHWDHGVPDADYWRAALRAAKPGAHLVAFGGTRTYHRLACAIEDAGWDLRDSVLSMYTPDCPWLMAWAYGSGFPKSHNLDGAREGWGTALKPAWEPIILARKPLIGTVAENVLAHGTGALNIDGCRVETDENLNGGAYGAGRASVSQSLSPSGMNKPGASAGQFEQPPGRWPANLIHDGSEEVLAAFPQAPGQQGDLKETGRPRPSSGRFGDMAPPRAHAARIETDKSAARFFYCAKASKADRDGGLEDAPDRVLAMSNQAKAQLARGVMHEGESGMNTAKVRKNNHPTVKPTDLMRYLCRLVTPPGGTVLDPFAGSGSTGKAAILEGFDAILIEKDADENGQPLGYIDIIKARCAFAEKRRREETAQGQLFTGAAA